MSMRRFIVTNLDLSGKNVVVRGDLFRHMARSLRLKIDTEVILADGKEAECTGVITAMERDSLTVTISERRQIRGDGDGLRLTLCQGLPKGDKMELILQKSTELGVSEVVPFLAERSIPRISPEREQERLQRWQRVAEEAARQAGCPAVPRVQLARGLAEAIRGTDHDLKLLLWEDERTTTLAGVLAAAPAPKRIAVVVGPEGGFTAAEAAEAREAGFVPVTLGHRILRTETAGIALVAILQYLYGDLGSGPHPRPAPAQPIP